MKTVIMFVTALALLMFPTASAAQTGVPDMQEQALGVVRDGVTHLTPTEAAALLAADPAARVLDVRTAGEFRRGHVAGAVRAGYFSPGFGKRLSTFDRDAPWIVQCRSGHRSRRAVRKMKKMGFARIHHMDGGMNAWRRAGLPEEAGADIRENE